MESLSVRNPLDNSRGRGTCGRRRITPTHRIKPSGRPLAVEAIPVTLTVRVTEVETHSKDGANK